MSTTRQTSHEALHEPTFREVPQDDASRSARDPAQGPSTADPAVERLPFTSFTWGVGIECSILPHLDVDQFAWTQHDRQWREDFARVREAGATHLRYAIPWHRMEPERGRYD